MNNKEKINQITVDSFDTTLCIEVWEDFWIRDTEFTIKTVYRTSQYPIQFNSYDKETNTLTISGENVFDRFFCFKTAIEIDNTLMSSLNRFVDILDTRKRLDRLIYKDPMSSLWITVTSWVDDK